MAASDMIGIVLMISLVVVGFGVISVVIMGEGTPIELPSLTMIPEVKSDTLYLYNSGGDSLKRGEFYVRVDGVDYLPDDIGVVYSGSSAADSEWESWSVGDMLEIPIEKDNYNQVLIISSHGGAGGIIAGSGEAVITPDSTFTQAPTEDTPGILPQADFSGDPLTGGSPLTVTFTDLSLGSPTSWEWDFGDGSPISTDQNPVHVYSSFGTYTVSLKATNNAGYDVETKIEYISVLPTLTCENTGLTGYYYTNPTFSGSPAAERTDERLRFADDYGSSQYGYVSDIPNWPDPIIGTTEEFSVIYEGYFLVDSEDDYTFNLTSDDGSRLWIDDTLVVDNWDDHSPESASGMIHLTEGYHPIEVRMYEVYEVAVLYLQWSSSEFDIQYMQNFCRDDCCRPPEAEFESDVQSGTAPLEVSFTDLTAGSPTSWFWDFGDGTNSTEQNPVHTYTAEGTYTVSLTVSNDEGLDSEVKQNYIIVTSEPAVCTASGLKGYYYNNRYFDGTPVEITSQRLRFSDPEGSSQFGYGTDMNNWPYPIIGQNEIFSVVYEGYLVVDTEDDYTFYLTSDDGSRLWIDGDMVVDNWVEQQEPTEKSGSIHLTPGYHPIEVRMFDAYAVAAVLQLEWSSSQFSREFVGSDSLCTEDCCSAPEADFESDPRSGNAPLEVSFTDLSAGSPSSWYWDFGDGSNSAEQNPVHTYTAEGTYTVSLTASNDYGSGFEQKTNYINVFQSCQEAGLVATYYNSPNFVGNPHVRIEPRIRFADPDAEADYGYESDMENWPYPIIEANAVFSVEFDGYLMIDAEDDYTFYLTSDDGSRLWIDGDMVVDNWGDHSPEEKSGTVRLTPGYHPIEVRMYDKYSPHAVIQLEWSSSQFGREFVESFVTEDSCEGVLSAEFSASPVSGAVPLNVQFTDLSTGDPTSWSWNFGDGGTSTVRNPSHTYDIKGTYDVTLVVANNDDSSQKVHDDLITVISTGPVASFDYDIIDWWGRNRRVAFTDESEGDPVSWVWSFGDGDHSFEQNPTHTFKSGGPYLVTLTVSNEDGSDSSSDYLYLD